MALALSAPAAPAAPAFVHFQTPSGNINCLGSGSGPAFVSCVVKKATWPYRAPKPASCDLDWNPLELGLGRRKVSLGACRGDIGPLCLPTAVDKCTTLAYGRSVTFGPFRCSSATTGVTCAYRTAPRVGFRIAREGFEIFSS